MGMESVQALGSSSASPMLETAAICTWPIRILLIIAVSSPAAPPAMMRIRTSPPVSRPISAAILSRIRW